MEGNFNVAATSITSSGTFSFGYGESQIIGVDVKESTIEIKYKALQLITITPAIWPPPKQYPHYRIWKDVYGVVDGKMKKIATIEGNYVPPQEEAFNFEE